MKTSDVMKSSFINMSLQIFPILSALLSVPLTIKWFGSELFAVFSFLVNPILHEIAFFSSVCLGVENSVKPFEVAVDTFDARFVKGDFTKFIEHDKLFDSKDTQLLMLRHRSPSRVRDGSIELHFSSRAQAVFVAIRA